MNYSKDGITVAPCIDTSHPKKDGRFPVKIRVTYKRTRQYYPTGKAFLPEEWESMLTSKARNMVSVRKDIENSYNVVRNTVEELANLGTFSFDSLNKRLKSGDMLLNSAFSAKIAELKAQDRIGSMLVYRVVLQGIERFAGTHIPMDAVTVEWVRRYEKFLLKEQKSTTTIGIHMRHLRAVLNDACRNGIIKEAQYPFGRGRYEIQAGEGRKMALTLEQIGRIVGYDDGSETTARYRDYWLFLYLCNGINVADFVKLRYRDIVDGEICFVRQKTERTTKTRKEIRAVITERMQAIIDRWGNRKAADNFIFPILDGTEDAAQRHAKTIATAGSINVRMRTIGQALGIGNISTYTARHSFATVLKRAGANIAYISESLGHQDLKTTENYLASFEREERQRNAELLTQF